MFVLDMNLSVETHQIHHQKRAIAKAAVVVKVMKMTIHKIKTALKEKEEPHCISKININKAIERICSLTNY